MKSNFLNSRKFWWRLIAFAILLPLLVFGIILAVMYNKQDDIIQSQISSLNEEYEGRISVGKAHLSPFQNFPYISVKIDDVHVYETKAEDAPVILDVADIYAGFNLWDIVSGNYDVQTLLVEEGVFNIVLHEDGTNNLQNALSTPTESSEEGEALKIHLKNVELKNLDIHKFDEATNMDVETFIYWAKGGFQTGKDEIAAHIDTEFQLNITDDGRPTYVYHKHFEAHSDITLDENTGMLTIQPSGITMEHGDFDIEGTIDTKNDITLDLSVTGSKPNFDLFIAFAPEDLIPVLEQYNNAGKIYFNSTVKGPTLHGQIPFVDVNFGASEAFLENTEKGKIMDNLGFNGYFTTGAERNLKSMEFSFTDMTARLEQGDLTGDVVVKNFESPEVDMQLNVDFNLEFLAGFLNLTDLDDTSGEVDLKMRFHDVIDLNQPEKTLDNLNKAYFSELKVSNLSFTSEDFPAPLEKLDVHLTMNGKEAILDQFQLLMGESDLSMSGFISDLPAIVHHTDKPVEVHLDLVSNVLDIAQLTKFSEKDSTGVNERLEDLSLGLSFKSSAKAFTESEHLPIGEFFIDSLHTQLQHYPHELHDFHVDILIDDRDLRIVDFTGFIDDSDFHLNGLVHDYGFWMEDELNGDVDLDLTLTSDLLRLEDIFSYKGENYVPEDYRHEEFEDLALHVNTSMHYVNSTVQSIDTDLDKLTAKMHIHPMKFENFNGRIHYEDEHITIEKFKGKIGRTAFDVNLNYYLGDNPEVRKRDNYFGLKANYIDFDQLFSFNPIPAQENKAKTEVKADTSDVAAHADVFNVYELPFTDITCDVDVEQFIFHRLNLLDIKGRMKMKSNHHVEVESLVMKTAGGNFSMTGDFDGSNPNQIYLRTNLEAENMELDRLLFKFENFGQDYLVSDNLHGTLTTSINGNIRVYPDLVPDLDHSEIHMDVQVLNGRLENYDAMLVLADYMGDKDLTNVRFDTLQNHIDLTHGLMTIPNMSIESTLGHMDISGTQDMNDNIEYYIRIPWKTVKQAARYKLFGDKKNKKGETGDDEIIEVDPDRKTRYLNLKIHGTLEDYKIGLSKSKKEKS